MNTGRKKYRKKYDADLLALSDMLITDEQEAFVAALRAGDGFAAARFEQGCGALAKPRRECVKMFLCGGMTFEDIAETTGYLIDDVPAHVAAGVMQCVPCDEMQAACGGLIDFASKVGVEPPPPAAQARLSTTVSVPQHNQKRTTSAPETPDESATDTEITHDTPSLPSKKKSWTLWFVVAAGLFAVGVYLYMHYFPAPASESAPVPVVIVAPAPPVQPVPADTVPCEPVADSVVVAKPAGRASIVSISRGDDGQYVSAPLIGRKRYDEYLVNAAMPMAEESRGDVTMTFTVNPFGRPSRIRVTSVLTHEANHEAIRLVANGPEWAESSLPVTITIRFD